MSFSVLIPYIYSLNQQTNYSPPHNLLFPEWLIEQHRHKPQVRLTGHAFPVKIDSFTSVSTAISKILFYISI